MKRERRAWVVDRARGFVQGMIDNAEVLFQDWADEFTDEELKLCQAELNRICKAIGKTRTFASVEKTK